MKDWTLPLLPGEQVLALFRSGNAGVHATNKRLLYFERSMGEESYSDLNYGEVTSVTVGSGGRQVSMLFWTVLAGGFAAAAFLAPTYAGEMVAQTGLPQETTALGSKVLAGIMGILALVPLVTFLRVRRSFRIEGPGLLRDARHANRWAIVTRNKDEAANFVRVVREQSLARDPAFDRGQRGGGGSSPQWSDSQLNQTFNVPQPTSYAPDPELAAAGAASSE